MLREENRNQKSVQRNDFEENARHVFYAKVNNFRGDRSRRTPRKSELERLKTYTRSTKVCEKGLKSLLKTPYHTKMDFGLK